MFCFVKNINYLVGWGVCNGFHLTWTICHRTITSCQQRNLEKKLFLKRPNKCLLVSLVVLAHIFSYYLL